MIYELRVYHMLPGTMPEYVKYFGELIMPDFKKLGIKVIGVWQPVIGESDEFTYMLAFNNLADREAKWKALNSLDILRKAKQPQPTRIARVTNKIFAPQPYSPLT